MTKPSNHTGNTSKNAEPAKSQSPPSNQLIIETAEITAENTTALTAATDKYSDYEIAVEGKEFYEDALFSSEDELDQALIQTQANKKLSASDESQAPSSIASKTESEPPPEPPAKTYNKPAAIELNDFISPHSQQQKFQAGHHLFSKDGKQLPYFSRPKLNPSTLLSQQLTAAQSFTSTLPVAQRPALPSGKKNAQQLWLCCQLLGKYQWQKLAIRFNEYFGRSLPQRSIELDYKALKLKPKSQFEPILSPYEIKKRFSSKGISNDQLFNTASVELSKIAKCALARGKKQQLTESYSLVLAPLLKSYIESCHKQPVANKNTAQDEQLEAIKSITKSMIALYKQLYMPLYQASNLIYGPQRSKANALAYSLIDWLCLEQWLYSAMLAPLPSSSVKTLNSLFYALSCYEPELIEQPQTSLCSNSPSSLKTLYLRYQLMLLVDFGSINTRLHQEVIDQLLAALPQISLFQLSAQPHKPVQDCHFIPIHHSAAMQFTPATQLQGAEGIGLDLAKFTAAIKADYLQQLKRLGTTNSKQAASASFAAQSALFSQLAAYSKQQTLGYYSLYQPLNISLFCGFNDCFSHNLFSYKQNLKSQQTGADIELPQPPKASSCPWAAAVDDGEQLCLQTAAAKLTAKLNIGQPVIISRQQEGQAQPESQLAVVTRITRSQPKLIELALSKLAQHFTGATINEALPPHNKALLYCHDKQYFLLTQNSEPCWKGKTLALTLHNEQSTVVCIKGLSQDFGQHRIYQLF